MTPSLKERITHEKVLNILKIWIPLAAAVTLLSGLVYLLVQQDVRLSANMPQVQLADDIAFQMGENGSSAIFRSRNPVEISTGLAPYVLLFDNSGKLVTSSATLHGQQPHPPQGILDYAFTYGENRVTWQPEKGIRQALVVVRYSGPKSAGYVAVGRSLAEAEKIIDSLTLIAFLGWVTTSVTSLVLVATFQFII